MRFKLSDQGVPDRVVKLPFTPMVVREQKMLDDYGNPYVVYDLGEWSEPYRVTSARLYDLSSVISMDNANNLQPVGTISLNQLDDLERMSNIMAKVNDLRAVQNSLTNEE